MSSKLEKNKALLCEARNKLEEKRVRIDCLDLKIIIIMIDRDSLRMWNNLLVKQQNIYCNTKNDYIGSLLFFITHWIHVMNSIGNIILLLTLSEN